MYRELRHTGAGKKTSSEVNMAKAVVQPKLLICEISTSKE